MNCTPQQRDSVILGLRYLLQGYEEGNLILTASYELWDFFSPILLDDRCRKIIHYLEAHNSFTYPTMWNTIVVLQDADPLKHEIDITFFNHSSKIQPPILLCENLNDAKFYFKLCGFYLGKPDMINGTNLRGGGGASIAGELEQIVKENNTFVISIVDSDVKYPKCPDGGTYFAIKNKHLPESANMTVFKINVHEVENLIPFSFVRNHVKKDNKAAAFLKKLAQLQNRADIMRYYDIKLGICRSAIDGNPDYYDFAEMIFNSIASRKEKDGFIKYVKKIPAKGNVFPAIKKNLLDSFICSPNFSNIDYYLDSEYSNISNIVFTFLCSRVNDPIN